MVDLGTKTRSVWGYLSWLPSAGCMLAIVWLRVNAESLDFGMVNVLSYLLLIAMWIFAILALAFTAGYRAGVMLLVTPIIVGALFLVFFRLERFDSEINPQFVSRWGVTSKLPESSAKKPPGISETEQAVTDVSANPTDIFAPRATDFPEFLGPQRDATLRTVQLETDWAKTAPRIAWKQPIGQGWSGFAVQGDAAFTMEQREQAEWVTCYNANTGELLWHFELPGLHTHPLGGTGPRSTPTVRDGKVYALSAISDLVCLDMRSGNKLWSVSLNELADVTKTTFEKEVSWGRSASPLVFDGKVVVPLGGISEKPIHSLIAFAADTGVELWRGGSDQINYSTPVLATLLGQPQILLISQSLMTAHSIAHGEVLWSVDWPSHSNSDASVSQPIVLDDSHVLMSKGYSGGAQVLEISKSDDTWRSTVQWKENSVLKTKFTSCVVLRGHAFGLSDGILECVDLSTGKRAWKKGRYRHGQILLVGDTLLITTEAGEIVLVAADPEQHRELASLPVIGDVTWNTAALSGDRLLMRNSNEAACVILPLRETTSDEGPRVDASSQQSETIAEKAANESK